MIVHTLKLCTSDAGLIADGRTFLNVSKCKHFKFYDRKQIMPMGIQYEKPLINLGRDNCLSLTRLRFHFIRIMWFNKYAQLLS